MRVGKGAQPLFHILNQLACIMISTVRGHALTSHVKVTEGDGYLAFKKHEACQLHVGHMLAEDRQFDCKAQLGGVSGVTASTGCSAPNFTFGVAFSCKDFNLLNG